MKSYLLSILTWTILCSLNNTNTSVIDRILDQKIPWELKASKDKLSIHYRWLRNINNDKTRQLRCSTPTKINSEALLKALQDPEFSSEWLKRLKECRIIPSESANIWYTYLRFDFPWPMSERDVVIQNKLVTKGNTTLIELKSVEGIIPMHKNTTRMKGFYGYWRLNGQNTLEYSFYSDVKSKVPTWTTDPFIEHNLFESVYNFNLEVEKIQITQQL